MLLVHFELFRFAISAEETSFVKIFDLIHAYGTLINDQRQFKIESMAPRPQFNMHPFVASNHSMNTPLYSQSFEHQRQFVQDGTTLIDSAHRENTVSSGHGVFPDKSGFGGVSQQKWSQYNAEKYGQSSPNIYQNKPY